MDKEPNYPINSLSNQQKRVFRCNSNSGNGFVHKQVEQLHKILKTSPTYNFEIELMSDRTSF